MSLSRVGVLCGLLGAAVVLAQNPEDAVIHSGAPWFTVDGQRMYAGGGNLFKDNGLYWWIGEGNKTLPPKSGGDCSECFNLYSSPDLSAWTFSGCVVKNEDLRAAMPAEQFKNVTAYPFYRMERPKVFKSPKTGKYVIWFHCDTDGFAISSVGVLTADAITGPYTFASPCFKPDGLSSYDMGVYYDDPAVHPLGDGKWYLVRAVENSYAGVSQMNDECTNVTGIISGGTPKMEAVTIMRDPATGILHLAGSHETGWGPNGAIFLTSANMSLVGAQWGDSYNPSSSGSTWNSQSTYLYPFRHANGSYTHIWMADRWNMWGPGSIQNFTAIWLPLIAPTGPPPSIVQSGFNAQLTKCNSSDPTQLFQWTTTPPQVQHVGSGLCVTQGEYVDAVGDTVSVMLTNPCSGVVGGNQTWYRTGQSFTNTSFGFGNGCVAWNSGGAAQGNNIITYRCGNSTDWQSRFDAPLYPSTPGHLEALSDASPTGFCVAGAPQWNPALFNLPWQDSWSLKNF